MSKQTQEMQQIEKPLFGKQKDEVKQEQKRAARTYCFEIAKDAPLQTAFTDLRNGGLWSAVYEALRDAPTKKIEVILPSGARSPIASESLHSDFFGKLYAAMKNEDTKDIQDTISKKKQIRYMLSFVVVE
jgi:hypothetical protein